MATHTTKFGLGDRVADTRSGERGLVTEIRLSLDAEPRYTVELDASPDDDDTFRDDERTLPERRLIGVVAGE